MEFHEFIKKLQNLPESKKKAIIATVVILVALILGFFWVKSAQSNISNISDSLKNVNLPDVNVVDNGPVNDAANVADTSNSDTANNTVQLIDAADWKTYTNAQYGFEVEYPKDWYVGTGGSDSGIYISSVSPENGAAFTSEGLNIVADKIKADSSLSSEVKARYTDKGIDFTSENIKIGGVDGFIVTTVCQGVGCGAPEWIFINSGYFYHISSGLDSTKQRAIFDQIIATFKFTNNT